MTARDGDKTLNADVDYLIDAGTYNVISMHKQFYIKIIITNEKKKTNPGPFVLFSHALGRLYLLFVAYINRRNSH